MVDLTQNGEYRANFLPLITIIIAVFNGAETLQRCIDSILKQTYSSFEIIIIDGGSTDGTVNILKKNNLNLAYWRSDPDRGISDAWNKGLPYAKGEWILFLGDDDYIWEKDSLRQFITLIVAADSKFRVIYGQIVHITIDGTRVSVHGKPWGKVCDSFRQLEMSIPHQGAFHHASLFKEYGHFDTSFKLAGDYEFLLRELKDNDALFIELIIVGMGYGGLSTQGNLRHKFYSEFSRAQQKHKIENGLEERSWWRRGNILKGIVKYYLLRDKHFN